MKRLCLSKSGQLVSLLFGCLVCNGIAHADMLDFKNSSNQSVTINTSQEQCFSASNDEPAQFNLIKDASREIFTYLNQDCYFGYESAWINYVISYNGTPIYTVRHIAPQYAESIQPQDMVTEDNTIQNCNFHVTANVESPVLYDQSLDSYTITGSCNNN